MIITVDELKKYEAPDEYISELGADTEFLNILERPAPSTDFLHFIVRYFGVSDEEINAYLKKVEVERSIYAYTSDHVKDSSYILRSSNVSDSHYAIDSTNITKSKYIYLCDNVNRSIDVLDSKNVNSSNEIYYSDGISYCSNICKSIDCTWSNNIFQSKHIDDSYFIYLSENCKKSAFLGFCHNVSNCLFCSGLEGAQWMIFNENVEPAQYMYYEESLRDRLETEITHIFPIDESHSLIPEERYTLKMRPDVIFEGLSADFYGWISRLPGYSDEKFLSLFFTPPNI